MKSVKRAWQRAVLVAHGFKPEYATKVIRDDATNEERTVHTRRCSGSRSSTRVSSGLQQKVGNGAAQDEVLALYAQANLLQIMQCTACNALHDVKARCCRWLLQTQDRVESDEFLLKHEFLAFMLGVQRPTVTLVMGRLQHSGLISSRYGRIRVLKRKQLESASCECWEVIREHFERLGL